MKSTRPIYTAKIKKLGNSGYVPLPKEEIGKDAVVMVIQPPQPKEDSVLKSKEEIIFEQLKKVNDKLKHLEKLIDNGNNNSVTEVLGRDKKGFLIFGKERKMEQSTK